MYVCEREGEGGGREGEGGGRERGKAGGREGENIGRVKAFVFAPRDGDSQHLVTEY